MADVPRWGWGLIGLIVGAIAGSFAATLVLRWPAGKSIADGRSRCDGCQRPLAAVELVPVLSYVALRGRCRRCQGQIDFRHVVIEAMAAIVGGGALLAAPGLAGVSGALFGWGLLALAALDLEHFWLPDALTLPLLALGLTAGAIGCDPSLADRLIGAALGYLALAAIGAAYARLRGRQGLGGGDAKLFAAIGAWLGWAALPAVLLTASLAGLAATTLRWAWRRPVSRHDRLPLGTLLAGAAWIAWLAERTLA